MRRRSSWSCRGALCAAAGAALSIIALGHIFGPLCVHYQQSASRLIPKALDVPSADAKRSRAAAARSATREPSRPLWQFTVFREQPREAASLAVEAAEVARQEERAVQEKVQAALRRQAKRHKTFLKQLEAQGWHLSAADRIARGSLKQGRERMDNYLQTDAYSQRREARLSRMQGQGIIMAAGGAVPLANAYVAIYMLRRVHNCTLPIELYYNGPYELDPVSALAFEDAFSGLRCINIADYETPEHQIHASDGHVLSRQQNGWVLKAQMLSATSFAEVIVLDADNVPLADPRSLLTSREYKANGNLFWPDFWSSNWHNPGPVYDLLNLTEPWEAQPDTRTTESGQFALDRRRYDDVIEWVLFLNLHADMVYAIIWGDKDTYRLAFSLAGRGDSFTQVQQNPANALRSPQELLTRTTRQQQEAGISLDEAQLQDTYVHAGMVQMAPSGKMAFLHRTAGSKLDPYISYSETFSPVDYITPPLTPWQAAQVHISGPIGMSRFDLSKAGKCTAGKGLDLVRAALQCEMLGKDANHLPAINGAYPIPLFSIVDFPELQRLLTYASKAFLEVQRNFASRKVPLGTPR